MEKIKFEKLSQDEMKMISGGADPLQPELGGVCKPLATPSQCSGKCSPSGVYTPGHDVGACKIVNIAGMSLCGCVV